MLDFLLIYKLYGVNFKIGFIINLFLHNILGDISKGVTINIGHISFSSQ